MIKNLIIENWKNFDELKLNFYEGVNFIIGPNGIGKTSLLEAIIFGLIGQVRKKDRNSFKKIGNKGKTKVILNFSHNGKNYKSTRSFNGRSESKLEEKSPPRTIKSFDEVLSFILNLFETNKSFFENIVYSTEGETYDFLKTDSKNFVTYLEKLIGFGKTRDFRKIVQEINRNLNKNIRENKNKLNTLKNIVSKEKLGDKLKLTLEKTDLLSDINSISEEINEKKKKKSQLQDKFFEENKALFNYNQFQSKILNFYKVNRKIFDDLGVRDFNIQLILSKSNIIKSKINQYSKKLHSSRQELRNIEKSNLEIKLKIEEQKKIKTIIDILKTNYQKVSNLTCPVCKKILLKEEFLDIHKENLNDIEKLERQKKDFEVKEKILEKEILNSEKNKKLLEDLNEYLQSIINFDFEKIQQIQERLHSYEDKKSYLTREIQQLKNKKDDSQKRLQEIEYSLIKLKAAEEVKNIMKYEQRSKNYIKASLIYDIALEAINQVLKKQRDINLKNIINEVQNIWKIFFPFEEREIYFNKDYHPYFKIGENEIEFENISGGEKMVLLILIKTLLLRDYSTIPFLILDEPLEHLNLENRIKIIDYLIDIYKKGFIKQLIITTFEESLTRKYLDSPNVNIISIPSLIKYKG